MYTVFFATGNKEKMLIAETVCSKFRIEVKQANIEIDEIQGEDLVAIVKDKVQRAYKGLSTPVVCGNPTNSHFI